MVLVVVGTGLSTGTFDPAEEAYYFRVPPWQRADLEAVLDHSFEKLGVVPGENESVSTVVDAVGSFPLLEALSTNGRAAHFVVEGVVSATRRSTSLRHLGYKARLGAWVSGIASDAVHKYKSTNSLRNRSENQRVRVAARCYR